MKAATRKLGRLEKLYRKRMKADRKRLPALGYWFDDEAADRIVVFVEEYCKHYEGEWAGEPFVMEEWQREVVREVFGWMRPDGTRRFRTAYEEVGRKNGKTLKLAAIGDYMMVGDGEPGAQVYSSATKRDQARILFDAAKAMVKQSPRLKEWVEVHRVNMSCERLGSKFEPLSAQGDKLDGLNAHCNLIDEIHAHKDRLVYDVLVTSMGARRQPLTFIITTAGSYNPEQIGWQMHRYAEQVLEGAIEDESFFAYIAAADPEDDWTDPEVWGKANPNLGVSIKPEFMAEMAQKAQNQPSFLNTFLRLHLNIWTQQVTRWIKMDDWKKCDDKVNRELLKGRPCFAGLDLSSKLDITALVLAFPPEKDDEKWELLPTFWVPKETIVKRSREDRAPYDAWERDGFLRATEGNVIDYDFIEAEIKQCADEFDLREVAYDPWNATQTGVRLGDAGITMVETRQGYASLAEPSKDFEALVVSGKLNHGGHPILRWMANNVAIRTDPAGNIKPDKEKSREKIDGIVAAIMATGRAQIHLNSESVYETQGLRQW